MSLKLFLDNVYTYNLLVLGLLPLWLGTYGSNAVAPQVVFRAIRDVLDYLSLKESRQTQQQTTGDLCLLDWQLGI